MCGNKNILLYYMYKWRRKMHNLQASYICRHKYFIIFWWSCERLFHQWMVPTMKVIATSKIVDFKCFMINSGPPPPQNETQILGCWVGDDIWWWETICKLDETRRCGMIVSNLNSTWYFIISYTCMHIL